MKRTYDHHVKKVFPTFFGLSLIITVIVFLIANVQAPQASEDTGTPVGNPNLGAPVESNLPLCDGTKLDVAYLVDNSGSMNDANGGTSPDVLLRRLITQSEAKFRTGDDQQALLTFSYANPDAKAVVKKDLTTDLASVTQAVKDLQYGAEGSNVLQGVKNVSNYMAQHRRASSTIHTIKVPGVVIVVADGQASLDEQKVQAVAAADFTNNNIRYYWVSLGDDKPAFQRLAAQTGGAYYMIASTTKADTVATQLASDISRNFTNCLTLGYTVDKQVLHPGQTAQVTYTYANLSREDVTNATITHTLPTEFVTVPADNTQPSSTVSLKIGAIKAAATGTGTATIKLK